MSLSLYARKALVCWLLAGALSGAAVAATNFVANGGEYGITGSMPGDQVHPALSLSPTGGFLVWEDNITDGDGLGISALQLDSGFSAFRSPFRVNITGAKDQERPQVSLLNGGGAAFVWQGGAMGFQHIYARFLSAAGTWLTTNDIVVNTAANYQINPVVATLANSNVVVIWASFNQYTASSMQDVYGQLFSPDGQKIGDEFLVNQFTVFNQRSPAVAALTGGGFVVAWVSEQERGLVAGSGEFVYTAATNQVSVDVYARLYGASGAPASNEILVNNSFNPCASPRVAAASDGRFMVAWAQKDLSNRSNSWDIVARSLSSAGVPGNLVTVNTTLYGDQFAPDISAAGTDFLVVWTSLGQDGSMEGVYGQFLRSDGTLVGGELPVNTTWISKQMHPAVASDGSSRFLTTWSSFIGIPNSFDLFAQRYVRFEAPLQAMNAPFVYAPFSVVSNVYQPQLQVSWPKQIGVSVDHYDVYVDGASSPAVSLASNIWVMTASNGLTAASTHTFQVDYVVTDGRQSPISPAASGRTWMGYSWYGAVPFEWMSLFYGYDTSKWPVPDAAVASGGPTVLQVFLTGANPVAASTWLRVGISSTPQGYFLTWNPQPGLTYQVQTTTVLGTWTNVGASRFAAGDQDSMYIGLNNVGYYRVLRLR
ncbi:MAG TPA: hypothetical protein VNZ64_13415 [Candidatus Acidoferrum sp.]|jgi:hypothetical protein|nr:hypothetical protein [Candidatus Acidoferrum sp.]